MNVDPPISSDCQEAFVALFARHQRRIAAYIGTLLPHQEDADEVMQETSIVLWRRWSDFDREGDFVRWANGIAHRQVLRHIREQKRGVRYFDAELLAQIASEQERQSAWNDVHDTALKSCLGKLRSGDVELINERYRGEATVQQIADQLHRPVKSIYRSLERIREQLLECVRRALATGESP
jgi:RNA polymerase sigma-70 factor (ECF subfamily)